MSSFSPFIKNFFSNIGYCIYWLIYVSCLHNFSGYIMSKYDTAFTAHTMMTKKI